MFSPRVNSPLTRWSGASAGESALYWATSREVRSVNAARSSSVHQSSSRPAPSYREPWSSKPWPISWPITAPIAPRFAAIEASGSKNGGCRMAAGKTIAFSSGE